MRRKVCKESNKRERDRERENGEKGTGGFKTPLFFQLCFFFFFFEN